MTHDEIEELLAACTGVLMAPLSRNKLLDTIVNAPFHDRPATTLLGLGIIVLLLKNEKAGTIDRVALSRTEHAKGAMEISVKKFEEIRIPLSAKNNVLVQVTDSLKPQTVTDWAYMFIPALTEEEARLNQAGAAIACSVVYPLKGLKPGGALIFSYFEPSTKLTAAHHEFMEQYASTSARALRQLPQVSA